MAKTALQLVNNVLKQAHRISGSQGELTTFTDSARQNWIDTALQAANETIDELYSAAGMMLPQIISEGTIVLADGDRSYPFTGALIYELLVDETNGRYLEPYPGGFEQLIADQPIPSDFTGLPLFYAIDPTNGELYLDREPTASEVGLTYKFRAEKDGVLDDVADTVPFEDKVYRALIPAVVQMFTFYDKKEFAGEIYSMSMGRAARYLTKQPPRDFYGPVRVSHDAFSGVAFPFEE